jgi:hypothetical protein
MFIKPTVGRVVWYWPPRERRGTQPQVALIAHVYHDTSINIALFDTDGTPFMSPPTSVRLLREDEETPPEEHCAWMPYQQGQARKHAQEDKAGS